MNMDLDASLVRGDLHFLDLLAAGSRQTLAVFQCLTTGGSHSSAFLYGVLVQLIN